MEMLNEIQNWYNSCCDGEWEHDFGFKICTLDNPGWIVEINLNSTRSENVQFENIKIERSKNDWVHCSIKDNVFMGYGGPKNLQEILGIFVKEVAKY